MKKSLALAACYLEIAAILVLLTSCATHSQVVNHAFEFDCRYDGQQDIEVLDYRYGNSKLPLRPAEWEIQQGKTFCFEGVHGPMQRGDFLYVKWRIKSTGSTYEDTVDLRQRLPEDINGDRITFIIKGAQLYVYLVTPQKRSKNEAPNGPEMYDDLKTITLYPDVAKP